MRRTLVCTTHAPPIPKSCESSDVGFEVTVGAGDADRRPEEDVWPVAQLLMERATNSPRSISQPEMAARMRVAEYGRTVAVSS